MLHLNINIYFGGHFKTEACTLGWAIFKKCLKIFCIYLINFKSYIKRKWLVLMKKWNTPLLEMNYYGTKWTFFTINISTFPPVKNYIKAFEIWRIHKIVFYISHNLPVWKIIRSSNAIANQQRSNTKALCLISSPKVTTTVNKEV